MAIVSADNLNAQAQGFGSLPLVRQLGLIVGMALAIALGVTVAMWAQTPNYSLLYGNLSAKEMAQVTSELAAANIEYKLEGGAGAILVPADKIQQARMKIASRGIQVGGDAGYELLEKEQGLGSSSFLQKARLHRAIEGELAKSIARLSFIEGARVHLAIPKQSAFARKSAKASASVVLSLMPGRVLDDSQIAGVVNMVASSVPGLENEAVTVIDQKGRLLSRPVTNEGMMLSSTQFDYTRKLEERYVQRIIDIISPIVGMDGVRAQVVADIDFTTQEQTSESYSPQQKALRSEQLFEQSSGQSAVASGVPGALSNQPPAGGSLEASEQGEPTLAKNNTSRAVRNYELDRTISHVRQSPVSLKKLSVAVVVDYRSVTDKKGKVKREPLSEDELAYIKALVRETVGLDESRGDSINVVNAPFQQPEEVEPLPEPPIWEQPWVWNIAKQVLGGLGVLLVIFGVLRPMLTNLAQHGKQVEKLAMAAALPEGQTAEGAAAQLGDGSGAGSPALTHQPGQQGGQDLKEAASSLAREDPQRVAQVMNTWVAGDE